MVTVPATVRRRLDAAASDAASLDDEVVDRWGEVSLLRMCQWIEGLITVVVRPRELRALPAARAERKTERANMIPSERNSIQRKQFDNGRGCRDGVEIDG